jgi:hypothetical protein
LHQVVVTGGYWQLGGVAGGRAFGITLLPVLFCVGLLFYDGRSLAGRLLAGLGALVSSRLCAFALRHGRPVEVEG